MINMNVSSSSSSSSFSLSLLPSVDLQKGVGRRRVVGRDEREVGLGEVLFLCFVFVFLGSRLRLRKGKGSGKEGAPSSRRQRDRKTTASLSLPLSLSLSAGHRRPEEDTHLARAVDDGQLEGVRGRHVVFRMIRLMDARRRRHKFFTWLSLFFGAAARPCRLQRCHQGGREHTRRGGKQRASS